MFKVCILSSRYKEIGKRCFEWAANNTPNGYELTKDPQSCNVFISILYDKLITEDFIQGRRCYNFHPGELPSYRGSGAYSWALLNKAPTTGVTLHEIDPDIDSGPIIEISRTPVDKNDTAETLFSRCMNLLFTLFTKQYHQIVLGDYLTHANEGGFLYKKRDLEEAKNISHVVRAFEFEGKESAYWIDSKGIKHFLKWE